MEQNKRSRIRSLHALWSDWVRLFPSSPFRTVNIAKCVEKRFTSESANESTGEAAEFKTSFAEKYSMLDDVYCVADGLKLYLEQAGDAINQIIFYNSWNHDHYVRNDFIFAPNGVVKYCSINAPGSMHDYVIAEWGGVYAKLKRGFEAHGGILCRGFSFSKGHYPFLIKSSQDSVIGIDDTAGSTAKLQQVTSLRQAAEWGIRAFQGTFARLKHRFIYEERGERKVAIICIVLLFNLRSRFVGMNQILNTYMPYLSFEATQFLFF